MKTLVSPIKLDFWKVFVCGSIMRLRQTFFPDAMSLIEKIFQHRQNTGITDQYFFHPRTFVHILGIIHYYNLLLGMI